MFLCEFQKTTSGPFFGRAEFPDRDSGAQYATTELIKLGEHPEDVRRAVSLAGHSCADTRSGGYGVRIAKT